MQGSGHDPGTSPPPGPLVWWALGAFVWCVLGGWTVGALLQTWRFGPGFVLSELLFFAAPAAAVLLLERWWSGGARWWAFAMPGGADMARAALLGALGAGMVVITGVTVRQGLNLPLPRHPPGEVWVLALTVPAALAEELFFRPVLQRALSTVWRPGTAVVAAALWFGLLHGSFVRFPEMFLMGVLNGVVYLKSGNYWLCALSHAAANLLGAGLWEGAAQSPGLFHPLIGAGLLVPVFVLLGSWNPPQTAGRRWRDQLRAALFGAPVPRPQARGRAALLGAFGGITALLLPPVGAVTRAELQAARDRAGGPEVRQRDEWVLGTNAVITVRSRLEFARWSENRPTWVLALAYPEATLLGVELAGEVFDTRPVGRGTFELLWPKPRPPPGTLEIYWELPLAALEAPEHGYRVRLQAVVPVHAYALRLVLEPGCGYVFDRAPERPADTVFSTSGHHPPRRDFGTCGLGLRRLPPESSAP